MNKDIMLSGVGGQGTVLASKIIASAAMELGNTVHSAETIGMAQRGGSVTSHVRIGDDAFSPLIPRGQADILISFEPAEAVRNLMYLKKDGLVIVNNIPTKPTTEALRSTGYDGREMIEYLRKKCSVIEVNADEICRPFGSTKYFNIAILGIAAGTGYLGIEKEVLLREIEKRVPPKFKDKNIEAFLKGFEIGENHEIN